MSRIIVGRLEKEEYQLFYELADVRGAGYWFPCAADGTLLPFPLASFHGNMDKIKANPQEFKAPIVENKRRGFAEPAVLECDCSREVVLAGDTQCECGQWYNIFGQKLRPPDQWEEADGSLAAARSGGSE